MDAPTSKPELEQVIKDALARKYTSYSSQDDTPTGNHYQSVTLGAKRTSGFRTTRDDILDAIPFAGQKVLDLGSNLGELSRAARRREARLVDGFEYDRYFVELANLVNAYNDVTRVSFFQRDITDPAVYEEDYDIVLAFSVFVYIGPLLQLIRERTRKLLILETHRLNDNLESVYLDAILPHFPYYRVLGDSDWGQGKDESDGRMVLAFAHDPAALETLGIPGDRDAAPDAPSRLDLLRSEFAFMGRFLQRFDVTSGAASAADGADAPDGEPPPNGPRSQLATILKQVEELDLSIEQALGYPVSEIGLSGWVYWYFFLSGYREYLREGVVADGNAYVRYMHELFQTTSLDADFSPIVDDESKLKARVQSRFETLGRFARERRWADEPVYVYEPGPADLRMSLFEVGGAQPFSGKALDGYHRIFYAKVVGITEAPFVIRGQSESGDRTLASRLTQALPRP